MKSTNPLIYLGFAIHILITLVVGMDEEILLIIMALPLLGNLVGLYLLTFTDKIKLGCKLFMWSSFLFVPIGMVAIIGCRKVLDNLNEEAFLAEEIDEQTI